jgi:hypothetical protein
MRFTQPAAASATVRFVAWTPVPFMLVALVGLVGSVLDVLPAAAMVPACPELGVEGVQGLDIEAAQLY